MTEKRFDYTAYDDGTESIYDRKKDEYYFDMDLSDIEELLNDLSEENEQLKKQLASINHLIDNKIDEFKNGDYGDLPCNTIHMFLDLKEEIGDLE